jgi:hypothetical protein
MSNHWYNKVSLNGDDLSPLIDCLHFFESEYKEAQKELKISGMLTREAAELPGLLAYRYGQLQELEALLQHLTIRLKAVKGRVFKRYFEGYNKSLTAREADKYAEADKEVTDLEYLINRIALTRNQFLGIHKGLETKHWQLTSIVKLKIAGMEDTELDVSLNC